ncbi:MAG TPA: formylglycine-generating enzyme family protein, partial [Bacteroidetes bacterium]|nr:formylglycine-generating enzyme family protein [Bacteroidota bacterium]HEX04271.1 formylglycine-generating enzyme family protein [Bacteroidota bacterium]
ADPEPAPEPEEPEVHTIDIVDGPYGMSFARIPEGSFEIGSGEDEIGRDLDEGPTKEVQITEFWLSQTEVTLRQWKSVMGDLPFRWQSGNAPPSWTLDEPVRYLNWDEAHEFINRLNHLTGQDYRLPTESEWEYACRAWEDSPYWSGATESELRESDWVGPYGTLSEVKTTERYNAFGLFDMHGNVSEWVEDDYFDNYRQLPEDGTAYEHLPRFTMKVTRGGSFLSSPDSSRSASRAPMEASTRFSTIGFRVAANQMTELVLGE